MASAHLPTDILLLIIESLLSANTRIVYPPSHVVTRTLLALSTVCRATHSTATKLLWRHCMYIDSSRRAGHLAAALRSLWPPTIHERGPVRMFLSPFDAIVEVPASEESEQVMLDEPASIQLDRISSASSTSSGWPPSALDDLPTAIHVRDIFKMLAPVLESLVIDMPLRSLYPESDHNGVRKFLRQGFEFLVNLEEFVSVRDELYLATDADTREPAVWPTCWPKLRRLALYNSSLYPEDTWVDLALVPNIELAVFARADPGLRWMHGINMKRVWFDLRSPDMQTNFTMVLVDCRAESPDFSQYKEQWDSLDPNDDMRILTLNVESEYDDVNEEDIPEDFDPIQLCQEWIKQKSLLGTLWEEARRGVVCR